MPHIYLREVQPDANDSLSQIVSLIPPGIRALDVGTGSGALGRYLSAQQCRIDGITYSTEEAELARAAYERLEIADLETTLPSALFANTQYDYIICADILEHLRNAPTVLADLKTLLAPQGRLIVSFPNPTYIGVILSLLSGDFPRAREGLLDETHVLFLDRAGLEALIAQAGFRVLSRHDVRRGLEESEFSTLNLTTLPSNVQSYLCALPDADLYQFVWLLEAADNAPLSLPEPLPETSRIPSFLRFDTQIFLDQGNGFCEEDSQHTFGTLQETPQTLTFSRLNLQETRALRLDLSDRPGLLEFFRFSLLNDAGHPVWTWPDAPYPDLILNECAWTAAKGIHDGHLVRLLGNDAWISFPTPHPAWKTATSAEIVLTAPQPYLDAAFAWADRYHRKIIEALKSELQETQQTLHETQLTLNAELQETRQKLIAAELALMQTRGSLGWFLRALAYGLKRIANSALQSFRQQDRTQEHSRIPFLRHNRSTRAALAQFKTLGIRWSVDRFILNNGVVSVIGWCNLIGAPDLRRIEIVLAFQNGEEESVTLETGKPRPDVTAHFPKINGNTGFFAYCAIRQQALPTSVNLVLELTNGKTLRAPIPFCARQKTGRLTLLRYYAKRLFIHLRQGNFALIQDRLGRHLSPLFARHISQKPLKKLLHSLPSSVLILDHAMGGGANHYRDAMTQDYLRQGECVLLWQFIPATLGFQLRVFMPDGKSSCYAIQQRNWNLLANCANIHTLVLNSIVSYPQPENIPTWLNPLLNRPNMRFILPVHDFFLVCPSHFLLNHQGVYCAIPSRKTCHNCLPHIQEGLVSLFQARDIDLWRALWEPLLQRADQILCFSENTRNLLLRAYPALATREIAVQPHNMNYLQGHYDYPHEESTFNLAMVGDINSHKGSEIFTELAAAIHAQHLNVRLTVIGNLTAQQKPDHIQCTGPYQRDELAMLLNHHKIHLCLMLSICPETFSYVTHELIGLNVPLFSFDLGAQGEAVRDYALGCIHPVCDGKTLLPILLDFKTTLDARLLPNTGGSCGSESPRALICAAS